MGAYKIYGITCYPIYKDLKQSSVIWSVCLFSPEFSMWPQPFLNLEFMEAAIKRRLEAHVLIQQGCECRLEVLPSFWSKCLSHRTLTRRKLEEEWAHRPSPRGSLKKQKLLFKQLLEKQSFGYNHRLKSSFFQVIAYEKLQYNVLI